MITEMDIKQLITTTQIDMESTEKRFGKELYQKRFKPVFEGYLTALGSVLELDDKEKTKLIRGN